MSIISYTAYYSNGLSCKHICDSENDHIGMHSYYFNNGVEHHYVDSHYHRLTGPAYVHPFLNIKRWYIDGENVTVSSQEEFDRFLQLKAFW